MSITVSSFTATGEGVRNDLLRCVISNTEMECTECKIVTPYLPVSSDRNGYTAERFKEPVEDMIIAGIGPDERHHDGRTDENGQVTIELPNGEYYWVTDTEGTGYAGDDASVTMDGTDKSITMTVTPQTSDLMVMVYDHEGTPLSDATVSVVTDPGTGGGETVGSATTNDSGVAEFEVKHGAYKISASHDEYSAAGIAGPIDVSMGVRAST